MNASFVRFSGCPKRPLNEDKPLADVTDFKRKFFELTQKNLDAITPRRN